MDIKTSTNANVVITPKVRELTETDRLVRSCWHCKEQPEDHAEGKCLFGATEYAAYGRMFLALTQKWEAQRD